MLIDLWKGLKKVVISVLITERRQGRGQKTWSRTRKMTVEINKKALAYQRIVYQISLF